MQELERREAIVLSIELWSWLKETGRKKEDWPGWDRHGGEHSINTCSQCFLCEYTARKNKVLFPTPVSCNGCPFKEMFGYCADEGTYYSRWGRAKTPADRSYLAGQFLSLLKEVLATMPKTKWGEVKKEKPKQYIIFDNDGYLAVCGGNADDEIIEGEDKLIEIMEELGEDHPETIKDFKVFKIEPVCFNVQPATVSLDC